MKRTYLVLALALVATVSFAGGNAKSTFQAREANVKTAKPHSEQALANKCTEKVRVVRLNKHTVRVIMPNRNNVAYKVTVGRGKGGVDGGRTLYRIGDSKPHTLIYATFHNVPAAETFSIDVIDSQYVMAGTGGYIPK